MSLTACYFIICWFCFVLMIYDNRQKGRKITFEIRKEIFVVSFFMPIFNFAIVLAILWRYFSLEVLIEGTKNFFKPEENKKE